MSIHHSSMERSGALAYISGVRQFASGWWVGAAAFAATKSKRFNDQWRP